MWFNACFDICFVHDRKLFQNISKKHITDLVEV